MKLSKGDAVTYAALITSAVIMAADTLRKEAAMPPEAYPILSSSTWSYAPLVLLTIVALLWLYRRVRRYECVDASMPVPWARCVPGR
jgi:hypothetical protein